MPSLFLWIEMTNSLPNPITINEIVSLSLLTGFFGSWFLSGL